MGPFSLNNRLAYNFIKEKSMASAEVATRIGYLPLCLASDAQPRHVQEEI